MKTLPALARTFAMIVVVSGVVVAQPAQSNDLTKIFENLAGGISGWGDLDNRRAQIEAQITEGLSSGQLTQIQAKEFRAKLAQINQTETQMKATGKRLSFTQSISLSNDLNALSSAIEQAKQAEQAALPDVDASQGQLQKQITDAVSQGKLTQTDGASLQNELQHVADIEVAFKSSGDGTLNPKQVQLLSSELDKVKTHMAQATALTQSAIPQLTSRRAQLEKRIADGVAAGKLTSQQASDFKRDLDHIASMQASFQTSDGALSGSAILTLAGELDRLDSRVDQQLKAGEGAQISVAPPALPDFDARMGQLRKKVADAVAAGKLNVREADRYNADLEEIAGNAASVTDDNRIIADEDKVALLGDLDRLDMRIDQLLRIRKGGLANIDARRAQLLKHINEGQASGKLTRLEAALLKREYNRITREEATFKASTGSLNYSQSARVSSDLNQLDSLITQELSSRTSAGYR